MATIIDSPRAVPAKRALELGWPIFWAEDQIVHSCTGFEMYPGLTLLMTVCGRDVPANSAYLRPEAVATCAECREALEQGPQVL